MGIPPSSAAETAEPCGWDTAARIRIGFCGSAACPAASAAPAGQEEPATARTLPTQIQQGCRCSVEAVTAPSQPRRSAVSWRAGATTPCKETETWRGQLLCAPSASPLGGRYSAGCLPPCRRDLRCGRRRADCCPGGLGDWAGPLYRLVTSGRARSRPYVSRARLDMVDDHVPSDGPDVRAGQFADGPIVGPRRCRRGTRSPTSATAATVAFAVVAMCLMAVPSRGPAHLQSSRVGTGAL